MAKYSGCCRICLKKTDSCKSVFDVYFDSFVYAKIIGDLIGNEICESEKLPNQICDVCERLLLSSYEFRKKSIESNDILNDLLEDETEIKTELEPDIKIEEEYFSDCKADLSSIESEPEETKDETTILKRPSRKRAPKSRVLSLTESESEPEETKRKDNDTSYELEEPIKKKPAKKRTPKPDVPVKRIRNKLAPAKCQSCNINFPNKREYDSHRNKEHKKISICPICGKTVSVGKLPIHLLIHEESNDYACDQCDKAFKTKYGLKRHITAIHERLALYKCEYCDESFIQSNARRSHTDRIHLNKKRYECKMCPAKFFEANEVKIHTMRYHTGERKHICDICEHGFVTSTLLMYHKRIHSSVKLFHCEVCGKEFTNNSGLTRHLKIHGKRELLE